MGDRPDRLRAGVHDRADSGSLGRVDASVIGSRATSGARARQCCVRQGGCAGAGKQEQRSPTQLTVRGGQAAFG